MSEGRVAWFRWHNFPLPEVPLVALTLAWLLHLLGHRDRRPSPRWRRRLGWMLVIGGGLLAAWATSAAADTDLEQPVQVVDTGPYSHSRHPMYLAWTVIYLGVALLANLGWAWVLFPVVLTLTHREATREEDRLRHSLGDQYLGYAVRVPRYL